MINSFNNIYITIICLKVFLCSTRQVRGDNILKEKDIIKFYGTINVVGQNILTDSKNINIYKIEPCKILNRNIEFEQSLYNSYLSTIKMMDFNYQILVDTKKIETEKLIDKLNNNEYITNNKGHKMVINKYKEYLQNITSKVNVYEKSFYIITNKLTEEKEKTLEEGFSFLKNVGISINKIVDEDTIYNILYRVINQVKGEQINENNEHLS